MNSNMESNDAVSQGLIQGLISVAQSERLARHLGALVEQSEMQARAERKAERDEQREQNAQLLSALSELVQATREVAGENHGLRERVAQLAAEVKTLRSAILLAHSIGREEGGSSPLGLDVAKGEPFALESTYNPSYNSRFDAPRHPSSSATTGATPKKRTMSEEARARISAAQKARWARSREQ